MQARYWILCAAFLGATGVVGAHHWLGGHSLQRGVNRTLVEERPKASGDGLISMATPRIIIQEEEEEPLLQVETE